MIERTSDPVRLPPGPKLPRYLQGGLFISSPTRVVTAAAKRYGSPFKVHLPILGTTVIVGDPVMIKEVFTASSELVGQASNLGVVFGPGSTFSLEGEAHRARRKLLVPPFHGKRMHGYEDIVEQEAMREFAKWKQGVSFPVMPSMMRITVNAILRAVFGAQGSEVEELSKLLPSMVELGSKIVVIPLAQKNLGRLSPWVRLMRMRARYDAIIAEMIERARSDSALDQRADVLALLLQATYEDGTRITDGHIADELLTLLAAGHETTATSLAWTVERLRRHPWLLARLTEEVESGDSALRQATIWEVQRTRPVIGGALRRAQTRIRMGEWVIPEGCGIVTSATLAHQQAALYGQPDDFNPDRFLNGRPDTYGWIPFGGGTHRCIGAAFANMEMDVVLRTMLREFELTSTYTAGERMLSRGVAVAPSDGGAVVVYKRTPAHMPAVPVAAVGAV